MVCGKVHMEEVAQSPIPGTRWISEVEVPALGSADCPPLRRRDEAVNRWGPAIGQLLVYGLVWHARTLQA